MKHKNKTLAFLGVVSIGVFFLMCQCNNEPYYTCSSDQLISNTWMVEEYGNESNLQPITYSIGRIYFEIESDTTFTGFGGCNQFGGKYRILGDCSIAIYDGWMTLAGCLPIAIQNQERAIIDIIMSANKFRVGEDILLLETPNKRVLKCYRKFD